MPNINGTLKELQQRGVTINGRCVDGVSLSIFKNFGVVEEKGKVVTEGKRGKPQTIYSLKTAPNFKVSFQAK